MDVINIAADYKNYIVDARREFHKIPEASLHEIKTSKRIRQKLEEIGLKPRSIAGTGVIATIEGAFHGPTVGLRADIDALSVIEETGLEYASEHEGFMHACGHDAHIAILFGAALILQKFQSVMKGKVRLIFQPGEEIAKGAKAMIDGGAMEGVDSIFGLHVWSNLPSGKISVDAGPRMASSDFFFIDIQGLSCHGAMPEQGIDAIIVGASLVNNLQTIVSREISPLEPVVVSVGEFKSGVRFNIVAGEAYLSGTTRTFNNEIRERLPNIMKRIVDHTASVFRASISLRYEFGSSAVINDPLCSSIAANSVIKTLGKEARVSMEKTPVGEDFSEYQKLASGVYAFLGVGNEAQGAVHPQHSSCYRIDESALFKGAAVTAQYALDYQEAAQNDNNSSKELLTETLPK
jgi:amidohydrolase